jgi:hypothetical protein
MYHSVNFVCIVVHVLENLERTNSMWHKLRHCAFHSLLRQFDLPQFLGPLGGTRVCALS